MLLLRLRRLFAAATTPATTTSAAARRAFALRLRRTLLRLLRRALLLLPLLLLLRALRTLTARRTLLAAIAFARRTPIVLAALLPGPLLELLQLALHELARLRVLLRTELVVTAVRTPLPSLGIGFLARGAGYGFRQRHR